MHELASRPSRTFRHHALALVLVACGSLLAQPVLAQTGETAAPAAGNIEAGKTKSMTCAACHGADGNSVSAMWPSLAGQHAAYIVRQLKAFKNGERDDVTMKPFAMMLSEQDMLDVAAYFATQKPTPKGADPALVNLGQQIYRGGVPDRGIAACIGCHGPQGHGNPLAAYPRISSQHAQYVEKQLDAYASGDRRSDADLNQMMRNVASLLVQDEIHALASYVQGLQ
ncbi:MAG TPA: c-type cytochrome [Gammaproteobacteria bacterium]|nr:c-type cytochrome [Gammaproteobacteria bacterium]